MRNSDKFLIVHADDLGLSYSFNAGIRESYKKGFLRSTCLRTNGPAFKEAVEEIIPDCDGIGIGVHLNLVEGRSCRQNISKISKLCEADGTYKVNFLNLLSGSYKKDKILLSEIKDDFRDQIETVFRNNISPDHLNSHQHIHAIPSIFRIVCELAREYEIPFVRLPKESYYLGESISYHFYK